MNATAKDNAHILANQQAFMESVKRARAALGAIEGVVTVGFGQKNVGGEFTRDVGIVVFVGEKVPEEELAPERRIPASFDGYRTDVRVVLPIAPTGCDNTHSYDIIQGGIQIATKQSMGTLGCIVRRRGDTSRENVYLLTCSHLLHTGNVKEGDYVYHPVAPGPGPGSSTALGPIQPEHHKDLFRTTLPGKGPIPDDFYIDCAIARIDIDSKCWPFASTCTKDTTKTAPEIIDLDVPEGSKLDTITDVRSIVDDPSIVILSQPGQNTGPPFVYKVGRTTSRTVGIVRSVTPHHIEIDLDRGSDNSKLNCHGHPYFAEYGDSGAMVLDGQRRVVGMVYAEAGRTGMPYGTPGYNLSFACHILPVLEFLRVCVQTTTGSSYGSCRATDGSGVAPAATASAGADGGGGFIDSPLTAGSSPSPAPDVDSDIQRERLLALRDEFRDTPKGRELYETFSQVRREIGYLIRNSRRVKVAWHRSQGPAFLAHTINHLWGKSEAIPVEIEGVSRVDMLTRIADALASHGSNPLREAIERHREYLMPILSRATTARECLAMLREQEAQLGHLVGGGAAWPA